LFAVPLATTSMEVGSDRETLDYIHTR
jgi:hypothetical protein